MNPLSWSAQVAAHELYVASHPAAMAAPTVWRSPKRANERGAVNRRILLSALKDGKPHPISDIIAALPSLSRPGITYLTHALVAEGRISIIVLNRTSYLYQLTGDRHD